MRPDELLEAFDIDPAPIWPADDDRLEPIFLAGPLWIEFAEMTPIDEFDEFQLDPERSEEEPAEPPPAPRRRASTISLLGSVGVHLLVLIGFIGGSSAPAEVAGAIPVQLVVEKAPAASEEAQPSRSVSESRNATAPADSGAAATTRPPERSPRNPVAAHVPPPKPSPPPLPAPKRATAAVLPQPAPAANAPEPVADRPTGMAPVPGPNTSRGDYLSYLVTLTRGHFDLLPLSFLAGRRGRTILSVFVLDDGTISRVAVKQGSGYPDIDARIEQMVVAVGHFPPVPDSFRKPSVELDFNMAFPDALQQ